VTHQGSESTDQHGLLSANSTKVEQPVDLNRKPTLSGLVQCHFCGGSCSVFVRYNYLGRSRVPKTVHADQRGTKHDYSP
jgi:heterodisulfide reductase subunit C